MAEKDNGSIAARAWNATKAEGDPDYRGSAEVEFWNELDFRARKVQESGTAITNFEKEVQRLHAEEKESHKGAGEPMAVVDEPAAITVGTSKGPASTPLTAEKTPEEGSAKSAPAKKSAPKAKSSAKAKSAAKAPAKKAAKGTQKTDKSGHVPTKKEAAAIVKEQARAPRHP